MTNADDIPFTLQVAYRCGWTAASYRKTLRQNPFDKQLYRAAWENGWNTWHALHSKSSDAATGSGCTRTL